MFLDLIGFESDYIYMQFRQHLRILCLKLVTTNGDTCVTTPDLNVVYENCGSSVIEPSHLDFVQSSHSECLVLISSVLFPLSLCGLP